MMGFHDLLTDLQLPLSALEKIISTDQVQQIPLCTVLDLKQDWANAVR